MKRLIFLPLAFVLAFGAFSSYAQVPAGSKRPNILIVLVDDLGYGDLGSYGHADIRSPNLDRLAEEGVRFTDFYSAAPVCSPARAGFLIKDKGARHRSTDLLRLRRRCECREQVEV